MPHGGDCDTTAKIKVLLAQIVIEIHAFAPRSDERGWTIVFD
jgi:hypothetical protein